MIFQKERHPAEKYEERYAAQLYRWILGGGSFESFSCGDTDEFGKPNGRPAVTRTTKQNWLKRIPEFEFARHLAEEHLQGNIDRVIYARALGVKQKDVEGMDQSKQSEKLLMFLAARRFKCTYSEKTQLELSNPDGSAIGSSHDLSKLSEEQLNEWIKLQRVLNSETRSDS